MDALWGYSNYSNFKSNHQNNVTKNIELKKYNKLLNNDTYNFLKNKINSSQNNLTDCKLLTNKSSSWNNKNYFFFFTKISTIWRRIIHALIAYRQQSVFTAAFALSLLYMTVLGFDGLAISFGKAQNVPDNILGIFRSVGSILGLFIFFIYKKKKNNYYRHIWCIFIYAG